MAREDVYIAQLQELGVWNEAFRPMVKDLAKAERRRTRAEKEWAATVPKGGKPSFTHPLYQACVQLDRTVMEYREALGLTPKALRRVRGADAPEVASGDSPDGIAKRLDAILARAEEYDAPVFELNTSEAWANQTPALPEETDCHASAEARARNDDTGLPTPSTISEAVFQAAVISAARAVSKSHDDGPMRASAPTEDSGDG